LSPLFTGRPNTARAYIARAYMARAYIARAYTWPPHVKKIYLPVPDELPLVFPEIPVIFQIV